MRCARPMPRSQARLKVIGEVAAGRPFDRAIGAGEAARIFTGGVIPDGADAVVIQEDTVADGNAITITEAAAPGRHVRPAGVDFREGDVLLAAGTPPHRSRSLARRRHELSGAAGAPPPEGRAARHRRRAGDAGRNARPRPDRLFQRLRAARAGARRGRRHHRPRDRRRHPGGHHRRHPPRPRGRRRHPGHDRRRLGRRPRPGQALAGGRGRRPWRSGRSRCGRASR